MSSFDDAEFEERVKETIMKKMLESSAVGTPAREEVHEEPVELNSSNFDSFLSSHHCVVVDFWAEWCYPCKLIEPIVMKLAKRFAGKVTFARVNVDDNQEIAFKYEIMGIPTLIFFQDGEEVDRLIGAMSEPVLRRSVEQRCLSS
ncbi:MAG: thioredoxin [Conexivisphaera sp.]|jgi:thioredoxin 1